MGLYTEKLRILSITTYPSINPCLVFSTDYCMGIYISEQAFYAGIGSVNLGIFFHEFHKIVLKYRLEYVP
jgi:hypothetical protein